MADIIKRGDIVLVNLEPVAGSEQGGTNRKTYFVRQSETALIIQNDIGNESSPITIVAPITKKIYSKQFPTNVEIDKTNSPLKEKSTILLNQIRTIDKSRIVKNYGNLSGKKMEEVNDAIKDSLGLE